MTDTTTPADARPELKAAPPQLTRIDNPTEVRQAFSSLNMLTARMQNAVGGHWLAIDNLPRTIEDLAEVAERALAVRRQLITLTTPPPAKDT